MRKSAMVMIAILLCAAAAAAQQAGGAGPEQYAGVWNGSWEGDGAGGGFELTLEKPKDGPMSGRVSVTGEPTYKATFKSLAFDGKKMTATYDFPPDESFEVVLTTTFDGQDATGTWSAREKASGNQIASGSWKVSRK